MNEMQLPLTLNASIKNWRLYMTRKADPQFIAYKQKVLVRDKHTCRFCNFRSTQLMEVVNINHNYTDNKITNLATACPFCAQCAFIENIGQSYYDGGVIIYLPEMSQNDLNALCHILFSLMASGSKSEPHIKSVYRALRMKAKVVEKMLGEGMSQPSRLGQLLVDSDCDVTKQFKASGWQHFRVLPLFTRFVYQVEQWANEVFIDI
jgi:intracellular multiplication protein IcmJ